VTQKSKAADHPDDSLRLNWNVE